MKTKTNSIRIESDNSDWTGFWKRTDVEEEMRDLGFVETDWVDWIFDHVFTGCDEMTQSIIDAFATCCIRSARLTVGGFNVKITFA